MARRPQPAPPLPDHGRARNPRRWGLYGPFILLALVSLVWTVAWFRLSNEAAHRIDVAAAQYRQAGYQIDWKARQVGGYPFRLDVTFQGLRLRAPTGWGLDAPRLEAEAYVYALTHWLAAAPQGLTVVRPEDGPVDVHGKLIHMSFGDPAKHPPSLSIEGSALTFLPGPGARPFALAAADHLEFHLRPGPDDQGAVFFKLLGGKAAPSGMFGRLAENEPVSLVFDALLTKASALKSARAWSAAGGAMQVRQFALNAGPASLSTAPGTLRLGADGRLEGSLGVTLRQGPQALGALSQAGAIPPEAAFSAASVLAVHTGPDDVATATLTFQGGEVALGPIPVAPSPRLF